MTAAGTGGLPVADLQVAPTKGVSPVKSAGERQTGLIATSGTATIVKIQHASDISAGQVIKVKLAGSRVAVQCAVEPEQSQGDIRALKRRAYTADGPHFNRTRSVLLLIRGIALNKLSAAVAADDNRELISRLIGDDRHHTQSIGGSDVVNRSGREGLLNWRNSFAAGVVVVQFAAGEVPVSDSDETSRHHHRCPTLEAAESKHVVATQVTVAKRRVDDDCELAGVCHLWRRL